MDYQIAHAIEGRIRVRLPQLASDPEYAGKLQSLIEARKSITSVRINPHAQSIVITYKAKALSLEAMQAQIQQAIEQLSPPPPVPPPAPAVVAPVTHSTQAEPAAPAVDDPWEDKTVPSQATPVAVDSSDSIVELLPQPATQAEETLPAASSSPLPEQVFSTTDLARRLGVTSQALTRYRSKPDFEQWSQTKDPAGIAWKFDHASKLFRCVSPDSISATPSLKTEAEEVAGAISGGAFGGMAGETIGTVVGGLMAGPAGAIVGEEVGAAVGETIGGEWGKTAADEVERFQENRSQLDSAQLAEQVSDRPDEEKLGGSLGETVGEMLLGEKGRLAGEEIGAAVEHEVRRLDEHHVVPSQLEVDRSDREKAEGETSPELVQETTPEPDRLDETATIATPEDENRAESAIEFAIVSETHNGSKAKRQPKPERSTPQRQAKSRSSKRR